MLKKWLSLLFSTALVFTLILPGNAQASASSKDGFSLDERALEQMEKESITRIAELTGKDEKTVELELQNFKELSTYFFEDQNGFIEFDADKARKENVDELTITRLMNDSEKTKQQLIKEKGNIDILSSCKGQSFFSAGASSDVYHFDSCESQQIVSALLVAASVDYIASIVTRAINPPLSKGFEIAGHLSTAGAAYVQAYSVKGCGITMEKWWIIPLPWTIKAQC